MTPLAALLAVALAAGPSGHKRTGLEVSNAIRAKSGLLPRKPARARAELPGRFATVRPSAPTYLPDPAPLADRGPAMDGDANASPDVATADGDGSTPASPELVAARGPVATTRLPDAASPDDAAPELLAPVAAPDEIGALRAEASGVVTDVTLSMRFDP